MNIEPDAIETYQSTTTLLLAFKLAEKRYPMRKLTSSKAKDWNKGQIERIGKAVQHSANQLAGQTKDPVLYKALKTIVKSEEPKKVVETLTLTFNTMKRDNMI